MLIFWKITRCGYWLLQDTHMQVFLSSLDLHITDNGNEKLRQTLCKGSDRIDENFAFWA